MELNNINYKNLFTTTKDNNILLYDKLNENYFDFIYVHIPKNGGTTIRYKLKQIKDCLIISNPNELQTHRSMININHTIYKNYLYPEKLITFVREPLKRCISMFFFHKLHKKFNDFNDFIDIIYNNKETYNYITNTEVIYNEQKPKLLSTPKGTNIAFSWKNQSYWLPDNIFFIGKLENLEDDIKKLCSKINYNYKKIKVHSNKNNYKINLDDITSETKYKIYKLYETDYKRFNY